MKGRSLSILQVENKHKDERIEQMEGDLKMLGGAQNQENLQYMRHTLVKFLCNSSGSEQQMLLPAISQLLNLKWDYEGKMMYSSEENEKLVKKYSSSVYKGWFS